jgi:RNA polymerase sigma-70 factor (ECF subfamily)
VVCDSTIEVFAADQALCQRTAAGDREAGKELALRLMERVRASVRYAVGPDTDFADHVQHCLAEVLRSARSYRGECPLEQFADRVVYRCLMRDLSRRRRRERTILLEDAEPTASHPDVEHEVRQRRLRRRISAALAQLAPERRLAVALHWVHGYGIKEIAELTGVKVNTLRGRLRTAKRELRDLALQDPVLSEWLEENVHVNRPQ